MAFAVLVGILCVGIGVFLVCKPQVYWHLTERWKTDSGTEPSDLYCKVTRLGGGAFIVGGVVMGALPFILR